MNMVSRYPRIPPLKDFSWDSANSCTKSRRKAWHAFAERRAESRASTSMSIRRGASSKTSGRKETHITERCVETTSNLSGSSGYVTPGNSAWIHLVDLGDMSHTNYEYLQMGSPGMLDGFEKNTEKHAAFVSRNRRCQSQTVSHHISNTTDGTDASEHCRFSSPYLP